MTAELTEEAFNSNGIPGTTKKQKQQNKQILQQFRTCIVDFVFRQGRVDWKNISTKAGLDTVSMVVVSVYSEFKIKANQRLTSDNSALTKFHFISSFSSLPPVPLTKRHISRVFIRLKIHHHISITTYKHILIFQF